MIWVSAIAYDAFELESVKFGKIPRLWMRMRMVRDDILAEDGRGPRAG